MKKFFIVLAVVLFVFPFTINNAHACSCIAPPGPEDARDEASAVFSGIVTSVNEGNALGGFGGFEMKNVELMVTKVWKGVSEGQVAVQTSASSASCGFNFEQNEEYIVYANEVDGTLNVSLCSRTALLDNASDDVRILGDGRERVDDDYIEPDYDLRYIYGSTVLVVAVMLGALVYKQYQK